MSMLLTYATAAIGFFTAALIVLSKLGVGPGLPAVLILMAVPYGVCAGLAAGFRNHNKESWIVFVGTATCAFIGLHGVYAAFFSQSPPDPWKALMPPFYQVGVVVVSGCVALCSFWLGKRRKSQ